VGRQQERYVKPRLLDLFCGAGGAAMGYSRAGFEVVGVDIDEQPNFPFEFHRADALTFPLDGFDAIHASPPCPVHSSLNGWSGDSTSPDLIPQTRELLRRSGLPYVIENVPGAPLEQPVMLCGQALGLKVRRHRLFEASFALLVPPCYHPEPPVIVVGGSIGRRVFDPRRKAVAPTWEQAKEVMGMPWAQRRQEVVNAIPPAYTEHVGGYILAALSTSELVA
jgi:DNA (cytosine-5)-methyltransferase 1